MKLLEERIAAQGQIIGDDILKVDMFLNHCIDVDLLNEMGKEFYRLFSDRGINKILTVEASGIGIACITAQYFSVPVVFAKKGAHRNCSDDKYLADVFSFTKAQTTTIAVSKPYLTAEDKVLIIDDFLADGNACLGLTSICAQAGASVEGIGIAIEKGFQSGRKKLLERGYNLHSLAIVKSISGGKVEFAGEEQTSALS